MRRPFGLSRGRRVVRGRAVLRAGNSIDSVGPGPAELLGRALAALHEGAPAHLPPRRPRLGLSTGARLYFKFVPAPVRYWKFYRAASFDALAAGSRWRRAPTWCAAGRRSATACATSSTPARPAPLAGLRLPRVQHRARAGEGDAGHVGGLVGRVPARLPRAVDRRDGPARLLRLPAHGRSRATCIYESDERNNSCIGHRAPALPSRAPALRRRERHGPGPRRRRSLPPLSLCVPLAARWPTPRRS